MATILLVGSERADQDNLASTLQNRGHDVILADDHRRSLTNWNAHMSSVEIVVFDVTNLNYDSKRRLRSICQLSRPDGSPVLVLCISRSYRGPRFELDIERLGARFVYAF